MDHLEATFGKDPEAWVTESKPTLIKDKKKLSNFLDIFAERNQMPEMETNKGDEARTIIAGILLQAKDASAKIVETL